MKTPLNKVSQTNLPARTRHVAASTMLPALLIGLAFLPIPAAGQGISQGTPQSQVTAAASKVPRSPNAAWGLSGSENQGSTQPRVVFENGQLTISASDSSLADVLYALRACTGADIDIPSGASTERVTAQLGPGPARKVLSDLLTWSSFDYVIQGSDSDPLSIQSVTLMVRVKSSPSSPATSGPGARTPIPARPVMTAEPATAPTADVPEADNHTDAPNSNPNPSPAADNAAAAPPNAQGVPPVKPVDMAPSSGGSAGKSPADMIQELQQMYQQRRILQEQQNRGLPPAPGTPQ